MQGCFSTCKLYGNALVVKKYTEQAIAYGHRDNEVNWYIKFNTVHGERCVPKMLDYTKNSLLLEYVGEPIFIGMKIHEFKKQLRKIALFLESQHCRHCDINPNNLIVSGSKVNIIDFGWAVKIGQDPYKRWHHVNRGIIDCIGGVYRSPDWPNDRYALNKVFSEYSQNKREQLF